MSVLLPEDINVFALQHAWRNRRPHAFVAAHTLVLDAQDNQEYFIYMSDPKGFDYGLLVSKRGVMQEMHQDEARKYMKMIGATS